METGTDTGDLGTATSDYDELCNELSSLRAMHAMLADLLEASREAVDESLLMGRMEQALAVTCAALRAQAGAVLVCENDGSLVFVAVHGASSQSLLWKRVERTVGVAGWAVQNRKSAIVNNAALDDRFFPGVDSETGFRTQSLIASPILSHEGKPLGVLEVVNKDGGKLFPSTDLRSLSLVAHALGLILAGLTESESVDGALTGRLAAATAADLRRTNGND